MCVAFVLFLLERGNFSFTLAYEKVPSSSFKDGEELSFFLGSGENAFLAPPRLQIEGGRRPLHFGDCTRIHRTFSKTLHLEHSRDPNQTLRSK